ncbi:MAG: hypothetical protein AB8H47_30260 [Bacteroidia bacterium]
MIILYFDAFNLIITYHPKSVFSVYLNMSELQKQILALAPEQKLELIAFIAEALKEDRLLQSAVKRRDKIRKGEGKILSLEELKARLYGEAI